MKKSQQDIVLFPGWKKELERKGLHALKEKRYEDALHHFDELDQYEEASFEILAGKVICLIELGRYDEAIAICRKLMREDEEHYYKYLHIYVTILFQTSQYEEIVSILEEILENEEVPPMYLEQFEQVYDISKKFYDDQSITKFNDDMEQFLHKLDGGSFHDQWRMLSVIRNKGITKYVQQLIPYLCDTNLNPVIKTGIIQCFMEQQVDRNMEVRKFDKVKIINPKETKDVLDTSTARQILADLVIIENQDPTLYEFTKQVLFRFLYVLFPFSPEVKDLSVISEAVLSLALEYLQLENSYADLFHSEDEERIKWMEYIRELERKYFSQLD